MSAFAPTVSREQYQQLPPEKRSRILTDEEYARLTPSQLASAGLGDPGEGAPANFGGRILPNPDHIEPHLDTDSSIPLTRLPNGVSFQKGNFSGAPQMDVSSPPTSEVLPAAARTIGADFSPAQSKGQSAVSTVPIISPDGKVGDVPFTQMKAAMAAGGKLGVSVTDPNGKPGTVPADRVQDAVRAGGKIVPYGEQETQHPGFWATAAEDLKGLLHPGGFSPYPGMDQDAKSAAATQHAEEDQSRKAAGYSLPYRVGAPFAQAVGANVPGMEKSAAEGDVGGVLGHAAAPVGTILAGEAVAHGAPPVIDWLRESPTASAPVRLAARGAESAINQKIVPLRPLANIMEPADAAEATQFKVPGRDFGLKTDSAQAKILDATGENKPFAGGADEPPPQKILDATGENKPFAGGRDKAPAAAAPQATAPTAPGAILSPIESTPTPKISPAAVEKQLNDALGGRPLKPGVSLRNQAAPTAGASDLTSQIQQSLDKANAGKVPADSTPKPSTVGDLPTQIKKSLQKAEPLPDGFTPVESSVLKGYKYDPAAKEFTAITNKGETYTHGEVTPEQVKNFEDADSQGKAWTEHIRSNNVLVKKNGLPVKTAGLDTAKGTIAKAQAGMDEDLTAPLQKMLDEVMQKKPPNAAGAGNSSTSFVKRLVKGEAGQAGAPGSVTDADEGIAEIQNRPVLDTLTREVPARGFLNGVGADETSVLKTQGDHDSVAFHRQQIAKNGTPDVELHVDEGNNIIGAQGRHRALAAIQHGGSKAKVNVTIFRHPDQASE